MHGAILTRIQAHVQCMAHTNLRTWRSLHQRAAKLVKKAAYNSCRQYLDTAIARQKWLDNVLQHHYIESVCVRQPHLGYHHSVATPAYIPCLHTTVDSQIEFHRDAHLDSHVRSHIDSHTACGVPSVPLS